MAQNTGTDRDELKIYPYFWPLGKKSYIRHVAGVQNDGLCCDVGSSTQALSDRNWKAYKNLSMSSTLRHESWQLQIQNVTTTSPLSFCEFSYW